ncbi:hypothetical protein V5799_031028, partial [Amblyomma americanum]
EVELANAKKYEQESVTLREHLQETLDLVTRKLTVLQATDRAAVDECKNHAVSICFPFVSFLVVFNV